MGLPLMWFDRGRFACSWSYHMRSVACVHRARPRCVEGDAQCLRPSGTSAEETGAFYVPVRLSGERKLRLGKRSARQFRIITNSRCWRGGQATPRESVGGCASSSESVREMRDSGDECDRECCNTHSLVPKVGLGIDATRRSKDCAKGNHAQCSGKRGRGRWASLPCRCWCHA